VTVPERMPAATSVQPVLGLAQPTMLEIPQPHALDLAISASEADRAHAIEAYHRKKRARRGEFDTDQERSGVAVHSEVEALVQVMPHSVRVTMLGGPLSVAQVRRGLASIIGRRM